MSDGAGMFDIFCFLLFNLIYVQFSVISVKQLTELMNVSNLNGRAQSAPATGYNQNDVDIMFGN